ncbi:MAG: hypothetical protein IPP20_23320 [Gemmatimonadetes bacterium]|nr:hypothetical protein [Gemmatimonadota bacterium]
MSAIRTLSAVARATAALAIVVVPSGASAQRAGRAASTSASSTVPPYNPRLYSDPTATNKAFKSLRWRLIGPFRGGRVDAVAGDPTKPLVYYMGAVNGGVWKTTNAGISWKHHRRQDRHLIGRRRHRGPVRP